MQMPVKPRKTAKKRDIRSTDELTAHNQTSVNVKRSKKVKAGFAKVRESQYNVKRKQNDAKETAP